MDHWKQGHSDSLPLLTNNERIDSERFCGKDIVKKMTTDIGQVDMEEMTRIYGEEEAGRMMGEILKNNEEIIKMQKQIAELVIKVGKKKQQEDREMERRREKEQEEIDRWMEECRKRNEKEKEEKEELKRVDEE